MKCRLAAFLLGTLVLSGPQAIARTQSGEVDRRLARARTLYSQDRVDEAIQELRGAVGVIEGIQGLSSRRLRLADACQELGLSYLARQDVAAARTTLIAALSLDRARRLSPLVYSETVLRLVEEARAAVGVSTEALPADVAFPNRPEPGSLSVVAGPWAEVSVDGAPPVQTPFTLWLSPGPHRLRASRPGYKPQIIDVEMVPGGEKRLRVSLHLGEQNQ